MKTALVGLALVAVAGVAAYHAGWWLNGDLRVRDYRSTSTVTEPGAPRR